MRKSLKTAPPLTLQTRVARWHVCSGTLAALLIVVSHAFSHAQRQTTTDSPVSQQTWRVRDGLPQNAIQTVQQTPDGFLWIGTIGGLVRFDGTQFTVFSHDNTPILKEDSILELFVDTRGTLWIGTEGGGLLNYEHGAFHSFGVNEGITNSFIRTIFEDSEKAVWVGTDRGLFRSMGNSFLRVDAKTSEIPSMNVYSIAEDSEGQLLIGCTDETNRNGILALDQSRQHGRWFEAPRSAGDRRVWLIHRSMDSSLWLGTGSELWHWPKSYEGNLFDRSGQTSILGGRTSTGARTPLTASALVDDVDGSIWIGTSNAGVFHAMGSGVKQFNGEHMLADDAVLSLTRDRYDNIWAGTANGLTRISRSIATVFTGPNHQPISVKTIYKTREGRILLTSSGDRLFELKENSIVPSCLDTIPCSLPYRTVFQDSYGRMWAGTAGRGLYMADHGKLWKFPDIDLVRAFAEDRDGTLWVGTDSGLDHLSGQKRVHWNAQNGLGSDSVRALLFDTKGRLWVGTDGGLSLFEHGHLTQPDMAAPLRGKKVYAALQDHEGLLWFGTRGAGLWQLSETSLRQIDMKRGLPSDIVLGLLEGDDGRLWISSSGGIYSVRKVDLLDSSRKRDELPIHFYGESEGVDVSQMNATVQPSVWKTSSGELWFSSSSGAVLVKPKGSREAPAFPVRVEGVISEGREGTLGHDVVLAPDQQNFEINYGAIDLNDPEHIRFRYWLEGVDTAWVDAGKRRQAFYTNVRPGTYEFHLAAYDTDRPGQPTSITVKLIRKPFWYQTKWFYIGCFIASCGLVFAGYRVHLRNIHQRFSGVLEERARLAREMHDTLIQGCVGISALLEAAARTEHSDPALSKDVLGRARYQIHETVEDARRSMWNLRRSDSGEDLGETLAALVESLRPDEKQVELTLDVDGPRIRLDQETNHEVVQIAREAITNGMKHANASIITVQLHLRSQTMELTIADDGTGFIRERGRGLHYGLQVMEERAACVGGTITISSSVEEGTCVALTLPLRDREQR